MGIRLLCCSGSLEGGGSERQLWQLATGVDNQRFEPEIYLLHRRGVYLSQLPDRIPVHAFDDDLLMPRVRLPTQIHRRQVRHLASLLTHRRIEAIYDRTFHMTLVTAPAARRTGTPRISVIVSPPSRDFGRSRERFHWLKKRLLARAYRDPQCQVVTVSQAVADDAAGYYGLDPSRLITIPSPIDVAAVERASQEDCGAAVADEKNSQAKPLQGGCRVVVVGRLSSEKGQRTAIEALANLRRQFPQAGWQLDLIGDGPDLSELLRLVNELRIADCVNFLGFQSNPYPFMRRADVLCLPSHYEGLPNVALEAMCLGTPVIASDCSDSLIQLLGTEHQRGLRVPVGDAAALAAAIHQRMSDPALWHERTRQAGIWVREHHGLQPWLDRMQELIERKRKPIG